MAMMGRDVMRTMKMAGLPLKPNHIRARTTQLTGGTVWKMPMMGRAVFLTKLDRPMAVPRMMPRDTPKKRPMASLFTVIRIAALRSGEVKM